MEQRQYEAMLADAEIRLKRLRALYDQWFHGLERLEPQKQKADIERLINELKRDQPRNTALRFRMNQLVQRYMTYTTYWQRITRQIEEGTYKRDVLRARRMRATRTPNEAQANGVEGYDLDIDVESAPEPEQGEAPAAAASEPADADRPSRPPRPITPFALPTPVPPKLPAGIGGVAAPPPGVPAAPPPIGTPGALRAGPVPPGPPMPAGAVRKPPMPQPRPAAAQANGNNLSDEQMLTLYERYVSARRDNRERTDNVRLETVAKTVREMLPKLKEKHAGKQIDFEVVVKDGRVALKPVAR